MRVVIGALQMTERFESLAAQIEQMEQRRLPKDEQVSFAERALELRYPKGISSGLEPAQLLTARRTEDVGDDLWRITNRIQENLLRGGLTRRTVGGRADTDVRSITAIAGRTCESTAAIWDLAAETLAA